MICPYCGRKMKEEEPGDIPISVISYLKPLFCNGGLLRKHDVIMYYPHDDEFWTKNGEVAQAISKNLKNRGYRLIKKGPTYILSKSEMKKQIERQKKSPLAQADKCPSCGTEIPAEAKFCPACGTKVR